MFGIVPEHDYPNIICDYDSLATRLKYCRYVFCLPQ